MTVRTAPTPLAEALGGQRTLLDEVTARSWREAGWWENRSLRSLLTEAAQNHPDRVALVGHRSDHGRVTRTYRAYDENAGHAASVLASLGVTAGDTVAVMLPNWVEVPELVFGINEIGAVYVGIPVAYGERQVSAILRRSKAKVLIIPRKWRSTHHLEMSRGLRAAIGTLEHVVLFDDDGADLSEGESLWSDHADVPRRHFPEPDPDRICYLGFTSGTTGEPKGAMHNHNTLLYSARQQAEHLGPEVYGDPMVHLVASPVGHHTGFIWGIVFTTLLAGRGVYMDRWDADWGQRVILEEGVTTFFGAPTFLQDMMHSSLAAETQTPLRCLVIAGAPVPRDLPHAAGQALGAYIAPAWGMTECSILISCTPKEPDAIQRTDGSVFEGSEVSVVDPQGQPVPVGEVGDLLIRGPGVCLGYYDRPDATEKDFTADLWFRTGDRASVDENGWVAIRGRTKDVIIRGGENVPVTDVESAIFAHPSVKNAALIGMPDERLGERICAAIVLQDGHAELTVPRLGEFLLERGVSKHHLPEVIVPMAELPMTPSGKIQKFRLREILE